MTPRSPRGRRQPLLSVDSDASGADLVFLGGKEGPGRQTLILDDFPDPDVARTLSPNGRAHWRDKQKAGQVVYWTVIAALQRQPITPMTGRVVLRPTFVFPQHRRRDDDNLATGVMKVVRDALVARGVLADDSTKHVRQEPVQVVVRRGQRRLEIVLASAAGPADSGGLT